MSPQDLKRLIAGFLVFSAITSTITLLSLKFVGTASPAGETFQAEGENPLTTVNKNAFVEKLPESSSPSLPSTALGTSGTGPSTRLGAGNAYSSNLTQNLAGVFAAQMIAKNPEGPQTDTNGNPTVLNLPGDDIAAEMIKQALSKSGAVFDEKVSVPSSKIKTAFSRDDVSDYLNRVYGILAQVSSSTKSSLAGVQSPTADDFVPSALALEAALAKLSSLSVPKPLAGLHSALLGFFANQKNVLYAVTDYQNDPIKTIIAVQNEDEIISRDVARIKNATIRVDKKAISLNPAGWEKLYSEIFGIQKTHAALGFGDIVFDPANFGNTLASLSNLISNNLARIADWIYTTALRVAVNILINEFQNQVVNWIAGGGKPKFITDWNGFFRDVADKAAGQVINSISPQFCSGIGPLLKVSLLAVPTANTAVSCTFNQVVSNVNNFFNRFQNGSWYYYSQLIQPGGNYYGQLITFSDNIVRKTAEAKETASAQAQVNKGFLSVEKVVGCSKYLLDDETGETTNVCVPGYEQKVVTTPGNIVGETLTQSLGWKPNQIVSAQRFEDLVAAIVNASINRIMKEGLSSLTEAMNPPRPSFTNATPTGVANPANLTTTRSSVANLVSSYGQLGVWQNNQAIIDADTQWLALATQTSAISGIAGASTLELLGQLASSCSGSSANLASERITDINFIALEARGELAAANDLNALKNSASTATSTEEIAGIVNQLQTIDSAQLESAAAGAQARLSSLQYFNSVVQSSLANGDCAMPLPTATSTPPLSSDGE